MSEIEDAARALLAAYAELKATLDRAAKDGTLGKGATDPALLRRCDAAWEALEATVEAAS